MVQSQPLSMLVLTSYCRLNPVLIFNFTLLFCNNSFLFYEQVPCYVPVSQYQIRVTTNNLLHGFIKRSSLCVPNACSLVDAS